MSASKGADIIVSNTKIHSDMERIQFTKKYRPKTFSSVIGQQEAVSVLRNSVANNTLLNFILLKGTRGSGKCFFKDEMLLTPDGYVRAENIRPTKDKGDFEFSTQLINYKGVAETTSYYHSDGLLNCLKITTEKGYEISVTENHPLLVAFDRNEKVRYIKAAELKEGTHSVFICANTKRFAVPVNTDKKLLTTVCSSFGAICGLLLKGEDAEEAIQKICYVQDMPVVTLKVSRYYRLLNDSAEDIIESFMSKSYDEQTAFLFGLFRVLSEIYVNFPNEEDTVSLTLSTNTKAAKLLQLMLLNFGVISERRNSDLSAIYIDGVDLFELTSAFTLFASFAPDYIRELTNALSTFTLKQLRTRDSKLSKMAVSVDVNTAEIWDSFVLDKIKTIESVGELETLDFCLPKSHSFIASGIINHNTTLARIYAAAVNCEHPVEGNPCLECEACKEVFSGVSQDIIEIDAASKRTIDDMRNLAKQLDYATFSLNYRVIILDEVHSLTPEAWQSLLKTLEEPRENCIFVMATTDPEKIPDTILSRAVSLTVRRIRAIDILDNLKHICEEEKVKYEDAALGIISRKSGGIMRDAVKDLDTVNSVFGEVTTHKTSEIFSVVDLSELTDFIKTVYSDPVEVVLNTTREIENLFPNSQKFLQKLYTTLLDCVELKLGVNLTSKYSQDEIQLMNKVISSITTKFLWKFINTVKEQLDAYNSELPILDYVAIAMKQEEVEDNLGVSEKKEEASFDLSSALDAI